MKKLKGDSGPAGGLQLELWSVAGSREDHANRTVGPEKDSARKTLDISGRRCLESFKNANPTRLWARMFLESLVGTGDWYSTRCKLTWKLKGTKYSRLYFQLVPSALPTGGIGFGLLPTPAAQEGFDRMGGNPVLTSTGSIRNQNEDGTQSRLGLLGVVTSGLLPTPDTNNHRDGSKLRKDNNLEDGGRYGVSLHHLGAHGLLPTPQSRDEKNGSKLEDGRIKRKMDDGYSLNLNDLAASGLLATPTSSMVTVPDMIQAKFHSSKRPEYSSLLPTPSASDDRDRGGQKDDAIKQRAEIGKQIMLTQTVDGQLSHRFVMEMMGFPANWIESAFTGENAMEPHGFLNFNQEYPTIDREYKEDLDARMNGALNPATGKKMTAGKLNKEGLRMGGNAIVPQCVLPIFKALESTWK